MYRFDFIHEKGSGNLNEDVFLIKDNLFGVFDGATSLDGRVYSRGLTGGYFASNLASKVFSKNEGSLLNLSFNANNKIKSSMIDKGVDLEKKESLWSTGAAVVRIEGDTISWVQAGDCIIVLIYDDGSWKMPFRGINHDYETLSLWKNCAKNDEADIRDRVFEKIVSVRREMNKTYGVFNGEPSFINFLNWGNEKLKGLKDILIFTDGLFLPEETPKKDFEFGDLIDIYFDNGLQGIKNHVRDLEKQDPDCRKYPRFKTHDDIAAISINL